jgi:hypothetical protein
MSISKTPGSGWDDASYKPTFSSEMQEMQLYLDNSCQIYEDYPVLRNLEMIYDTEELAHNLWESGLFPEEHPRIEALFRRAAAGRGFYSHQLAASGIV